MLLLIAIVLAILVLPTPWNVLVLALGLIAEAGEVTFGIWYSRRRRATTGTESMVGETAKVVEACRPEGRVSYKGERWEAVCAEGADIGERVRIKAVDGLTLVVERITVP
jgi:membrane protein implicated in regulation of membrane protease activity